jgi:hypothetical protein
MLTRTCPACGHKEEVVHDGTDHGPILVQGDNRCNETAWVIAPEVKAEGPTPE